MTHAEENRKLARRARSGDASARDALITNNMPIVYAVVARLRPICADAVSVGAIGLIKAADTYDPERGYSFSTYAQKCVRNELIMESRRARRFSKDVSIHTEVQKGVAYEDILPAPGAVDEGLESDAARRVLNEALKALPQRERDMLMLYGSGARQEHIAREYGLSQSYVSRLNNASIARLRRLLSDQLWIVSALRA